MESSQRVGMVWVGRDIKDHPVHTLHWARSLQVLSWYVAKVEGAP